MRLKLEKGKLPWSDLRFKKIQTKKLFDAWCMKVMGLPMVIKRKYQAGVKKVLSCSKLLSLKRLY